MKKVKFLKLASAMLVLCLVTTCAISTTFAKYATGGDAQDTARVAKWGVELVMEGDPIFHNEYDKHDTTYAGTLSVEADAHVVAPGTNSKDANSSARFKLTGTPEVASRITINFGYTNDVFLKAKTGLRDWTQAAVETAGTYNYETFNLGANYYPVVFTLKQVGKVDASGNYVACDDTLATGNLADIKAFLDAYGTKDYAPNAVLDCEFELSWAWVFDNNDKADTYLGQLVAGLNPDGLVEGTDYSVKIDYTLSITVEQID